ncbi:hypothetical protein KBK24_0120065 [Burkholderia sp. K24]|nr:hypothetical protein AC233_11130 [Burkholderia sp. HB1]KFX63971.1 hypothetical protein KBK24_0120065 [Burkholderia sp. K24]
MKWAFDNFTFKVTISQNSHVMSTNITRHVKLRSDIEYSQGLQSFDVNSLHLSFRNTLDLT